MAYLNGYLQIQKKEKKNCGGWKFNEGSWKRWGSRRLEGGRHKKLARDLKQRHTYTIQSHSTYHHTHTLPDRYNTNTCKYINIYTYMYNKDE